MTTFCPTCGSALGKPLAATMVALHFGRGEMLDPAPTWIGTLEQFWANNETLTFGEMREIRRALEDRGRYEGGTGAEIVEEFSAAMHERIDAGSYRMAEGWYVAGATKSLWLPPKRRGRKDCGDWFIRARRDSRKIRDRLTSRVVIHQLETTEARRRFGHLITTGVRS